MPDNPYYATLVNQKLAFARVLLESARQVSDAGSIDMRVKLHGFLDGAVSQLNHALAFYVLEVADHFTIKIDSLRINQTAQNYRQLIGEYSDQSLQLAELGTLLKNPASWLYTLTSLYMNPMVLGQRFQTASSVKPQTLHAVTDEKDANHKAASGNLIQVRDVSAESAPQQSPFALVSELSQQLQQLIDQHRAAFVED